MEPRRSRNEVSGYYVADEIANTYVGMMIAIPEEQRKVFSRLRTAELVEVLLRLAANVSTAICRGSRNILGDRRSFGSSAPNT